MLPRYREFTPPTAIAHVIDAFWCLSVPRVAVQTDTLLHHRVLPDGCVDLIFRFQRPTLGGGIDAPLLFVYGPTDRFKLVEMKPSTEFVGIRFKPGEAGSCLGLSPLTLFRQEARVQECSIHLVNLFDRLCESGSTKQALSILQRTVLELTVNSTCDVPLRAREALRMFSASSGQMLVSNVAKVIGVSERTLRRDIIATVGLSPKVLARILRFQKTLTLLRLRKQPDLCDIAFDCGYADQAHMGREFQEFSGLTPTAFVQ